MTAEPSRASAKTAPRPVRIILNADDLGMSRDINAAIANCLARRQITSASIMANGPAFDEAVEIARRHPEASYSVHLNASEFTPLSGADLAVLAPAGDFDNLIRDVALSGKLLAAVEAELDAQIARVKNAGVQVSHLDSHHHVHTVPQLFLPTLRLARKHCIPWVRQTRNIYRRDEALSTTLRLKKDAWNAALSLAGRRRTDYFGSLADLMHTSTRFPAGSRMEIMVHPGGRGGYVDETTLLATRWWEARDLAPTFESYKADA